MAGGYHGVSKETAAKTPDSIENGAHEVLILHIKLDQFLFNSHQVAQAPVECF